MSSIDIKIQNVNGLNEISGNDLTPEETIALVDLARALVYTPSVATAIPSYPINIDPFQDKELDEAISKLKDEPITVVSEQVSVESVDDPPITKESTFQSNSIGADLMSEAISAAFSTKFGTTESTSVEYDHLLTDEERLEELNKDFHETGIKHKIYYGEITPFYRVRWECPKCGDKGNHYGPENIKHMFCYNCNAALNVRPANKKFPNRDDWGNFFIADELNMKFIRA